MKNTILILILCLPSLVYSQFNISGKVVANNEALAYATVVLSTMDDEFIQGTISDDNGQFEMTSEVGEYQLEVTYMNYETNKQTLKIDADLVLSTILLLESKNELSTVIVTGEKPTIRREIDKTVVEIGNNPFLQSSHALDALSSAPGIILRGNELVMMGKDAVQVSLDGRMLELSGEELINFLSSLSAADIKAIEIISNPSAKWDAEGNSGIINIVTKRSNKNAWSNRTSMTHYQAKYGRQTLNNSFSYKKNKLNLLFSTAINSGNRDFLQFIEPQYSEAPQHIKSEQKMRADNIAPRLLLDYNLNDQTTIGIQYMTYLSKQKTSDNLFTTNYDSNYDVNSYFISNGAELKRNNYNSSYNLYFDKKLDTLGKQLTLNFDVLDYKGNSTNDIQSDLYDKELNFQVIDFANIGQSNYQINNYSAKIDMVQPNSWLDLSYGVKSTFSRTKYEIDNFNTITGMPIYLPEQSNASLFNENIQSAYIHTNKKLNEQWEFQLGLRYEHTFIEGFSKKTDAATSVLKNNYGKLFPTFYAKYNKNENHVFSFNYGKKINRPSYSQLNPARVFISGQSTQNGNPMLRPSFTDNVELSYTYKYNFNTTLAYGHVADAYSFIFGLNDETQEQNITYKNLFNQNRFTIISTYRADFTTWWNADIMLFYGYSKSNANDTADQVSLFNGSRFYSSINNHFTLNKNKTILGEINVWYDSQYNANLYSFDKAYAINLAFHFKSLAKGFDLTIGVNDILNTRPRTVTSMNNNVQHDFKVYDSSRYARFSLSYNFGNNDISARNRNFGNEDVRNRSN